MLMFRICAPAGMARGKFPPNEEATWRMAYKGTGILRRICPDNGKADGVAQGERQLNMGMQNVVFLWGDTTKPDSMTYVCRGQGFELDMRDRVQPTKDEALEKLETLKVFVGGAIPGCGAIPAWFRGGDVEPEPEPESEDEESS